MKNKKYKINEIFQANSKELSKYIKPESVSLTITSPPYRNAINYSQHVENEKKSQKSSFRGNAGTTTERYLDEMEQVFSEVLKVTKPGGFCCIVIGDEVVNGKLIPLSSLLISRLVKENEDELGWHLRDMIIWNKVTAGRNGAGNRFGVFVQHSFPTYYRANIMHEYIIVLEKGGEKIPLDRKNTEKIPLNRAMKRQVSLSIWDITPVPPRVIKHPAVFPEQIPWRLIQLYSKKKDTVLDPMNGSGQTTKMAKLLGRDFIGIDLRKPYVKLAQNRLDEKFLSSNFMIPVYHPIEWTDAEESGKKDDVHLDVPEVPKGYKFKFKEQSEKEIRGFRSTYVYYKNKDGDYLCYVMGRDTKPTTRIKLGNIKDPKSHLGKSLKKLPEKAFHKASLNKILPERLVENRQPVKAIIDILLHEKKIKKTGEKLRTSELYIKIGIKSKPAIKIKSKKKNS
ncbi:DNA-methyltransferase [Nitrosopumilus sp.]|uniref:DNA-methyltransferase n=1 Tax=Nitrosopumilus sp. TaxID=2024843 RepID=UPI003D0C7ACC